MPSLRPGRNATRANFEQGSCSAVSASFLFLNNQYLRLAAAINVKPQFVTNAGANPFRQLMTGGLPHGSQRGIMKTLKATVAFFFLSALSAEDPRFYLILQTLREGGHHDLRFSVIFI